MIAVAVAAVVVAIITGRIWAERQLRRWCDANQYQLLAWRGAKFYEGPTAWLTSESQNAYRIQVLDRQGRTRKGYVVFGSYWVPCSSKVTVKWD